MKKLIPYFLITFIILGNWLILSLTQKKLKEYKTNPPFRLDDFTQSYRISSQSKLLHLIEEGEGVWFKLQEGLDDKDIELELRLTHFWDGNEFIPRKWNPLTIHPCSPSQGKLSILLREAINVDKELRLPDDTVIYSSGFQFFPEDVKEKRFLSLDLNSIVSLKKETTYPHGIYILVLRMKFAPSKDFPPCLSKVTI